MPLNTCKFLRTIQPLINSIYYWIFKWDIQVYELEHVFKL